MFFSLRNSKLSHTLQAKQKSLLLGNAISFVLLEIAYISTWNMRSKISFTKQDVHNHRSVDAVTEIQGESYCF